MSNRLLTSFFVMPAEAGIQAFEVGQNQDWIPACAGMTQSE
jgi:hypothetical protein